MKVQINGVNKKTFTVMFEHGPDYEVTYRPNNRTITLMFPKGDIFIDGRSNPAQIEADSTFNNLTYLASRGELSFELDTNEPHVKVSWCLPDGEIETVDHFNAPLPTDEEKEEKGK